jgi:hypothetical protein
MSPKDNSGRCAAVTVVFSDRSLQRRGNNGALFSYGGFSGQALPFDSGATMCGPCRIMVLSAVGICRRMMV